MTSGIRTRFAPSPTGNLHLGSARTALFCWLYAKHHGGSFILRIEDTDTERSTKTSAATIIEALNWLGLKTDEGPYYQIDNLKKHQHIAQSLIASGTAYRCYCSKNRLMALRASQIAQKIKPRYDGHCRDRDAQETSNQPHVVRFKTPLSGHTHFTDCVYGGIRTEHHELDDWIMVRSDGIPTYNFSVVIDDSEMKITHVIRGDDHISNTAKQILMFKALGATPPQYAHTPTILGSDGNRLSKRHGATHILEYRDAGYLPQALLNYLVRLGWSHGDQEFFTRDHMIHAFDLDAINKSPAAFDPEKLLWLNQQHIQASSPTDLQPHLIHQFTSLHIPYQPTPDINQVIELHKERARTIKDMALASAFFYSAPTTYQPKALKKHTNTHTTQRLDAAWQALSQCDPWEADSIHAAIEALTQHLSLTLGEVAQPIRIAVTGTATSPPIHQTLAALGQSKTLERIKKLHAYLST